MGFSKSENIYFCEASLPGIIANYIIEGKPVEEIKKHEKLVFLINYSEITNFGYLFFKASNLVYDYCVASYDNVKKLNDKLYKDYQKYFTNLRSY